MPFAVPHDPGLVAHDASGMRPAKTADARVVPGDLGCTIVTSRPTLVRYVYTSRTWVCTPVVPSGGRIVAMTTRGRFGTAGGPGSAVGTTGAGDSEPASVWSSLTSRS